MQAKANTKENDIVNIEGKTRAGVSIGMNANFLSERQKAKAKGKVQEKKKKPMKSINDADKIDRPLMRNKKWEFAAYKAQMLN